MIASEAVWQRERPAAIVVVGDVNASAACALVGAMLWIPIVHLEAGRRRLEEFALLASLSGAAAICLTEPLGYPEFRASPASPCARTPSADHDRRGYQTAAEARGARRRRACGAR